MTDDQRYDLHRLRTKAVLEALDAQRAADDKTLIQELLAIAKLMQQQGRAEARDVIHQAIARIEGKEFDGVLT